MTDTASSSGNYSGGTKFRRSEDPRPSREMRNAQINHAAAGAGPPKSGIDRFREKYKGFGW